MVTLRVGAVGVLGVVGGAFPDGDAVSDGDFVGSDEDVFDEQSQHALAFLDVGGLGVVWSWVRKPSRSEARVR
jgi:hypothetical protein